MKIIVISDIHLTEEFDTKKYIFLKKIISSADQIIINGDFWDGAITTFSRFINSPWKKLFPLLKRKKTIYLFGNHDKKDQSDNRVSLFSIKQAYRHIIRTKKNMFIIEHGDKYQPKAFEQLSFLPHNGSVHIFVNILFDKFERLLFKIFGEKTIQKKLYGKLNNETKLNIKQLVSRGQMYVCGHTHAQELDFKNRFINTGIIRHGIGQYLLIEDDVILLKSERYDK